MGEDAVSVATTLVRELKANHLEGTYGFVNGDKLASRPGAPEALQIWLDAGMNIGNHSWSHMSLTTNTAEAFEQDIAKNEPTLGQYGEVRDWRWFRFPYLEEGETVEKRRAIRAWLTEHGYRIAQVTLQFADYEWNDAYCRCRAKQDEAAIARLKQSYLDAAAEDIALGREEEQLVFGREIPDVMLLHETPFTTLMLPDLLDLLRKQGFSFESLSQVESDPAYSRIRTRDRSRAARFRDSSWTRATCRTLWSSPIPTSRFRSYANKAGQASSFFADRTLSFVFLNHHIRSMGRHCSASVHVL